MEARPNQGWRVENVEEEADEVEVDFVRGNVEWEFEAELENGRIQVRMDQMSLQGVPLYNAQADLSGVNVSVPSLLEGSPRIESQGCSMSVEVPAFSIDQNQECLTYLGLAPAW